MTINFRVMFLFSAVASLFVTLPLCLYFARKLQWSRWPTFILSFFITNVLFTGLFAGLVYFEILEIVATAYLIILAPLALTSGIVAWFLAKWLTKSSS